MTYQDVAPYLHSAVTYTIGYFIGRHRGKRNAEPEIVRLRLLGAEALELAKKANKQL